MKRSTALLNAAKLHDRLTQWNGRIPTPRCRYRAVRIKSAWVFGSTAKGSDSPNDLDVIIDYEYIGNKRKMYRSDGGVNKQLRYNKEYLRRYGILIPVCSLDAAITELRKNMKKISIHEMSVDGELAVPRIQIYPQFNLQGE